MCRKRTTLAVEFSLEDKEHVLEASQCPYEMHPGYRLRLNSLALSPLYLLS